QAVYANRNRLRSGIGKAAMRRRGEFVERSFAHTLERGGMRRTWLRGRDNVQKRYLIHVCGFNLGVLMRALTGAGTPKETAARAAMAIFVIHAADFVIVIIVAASSASSGRDVACLAISVAAQAK
ncbi:MAG: transposase, partial [Candidatus Thiodiazotropha sp.]